MAVVNRTSTKHHFRPVLSWTLSKLHSSLSEFFDDTSLKLKCEGIVFAQCSDVAEEPGLQLPNPNADLPTRINQLYSFLFELITCQEAISKRNRQTEDDTKIPTKSLAVLIRCGMTKPAENEETTSEDKYNVLQVHLAALRFFSRCLQLKFISWTPFGKVLALDLVTELQWVSLISSDFATGAASDVLSSTKVALYKVIECLMREMGLPSNFHLLFEKIWPLVLKDIAPEMPAVPESDPIQILAQPPVQKKSGKNRKRSRKGHTVTHIETSPSDQVNSQWKTLQEVQIAALDCLRSAILSVGSFIPVGLYGQIERAIARLSLAANSSSAGSTRCFASEHSLLALLKVLKALLTSAAAATPPPVQVAARVFGYFRYSGRSDSIRSVAQEGSSLCCVISRPLLPALDRPADYNQPMSTAQTALPAKSASCPPITEFLDQPQDSLRPNESITPQGAVDRQQTSFVYPSSQCPEIINIDEESSSDDDSHSQQVATKIDEEIEIVEDTGRKKMRTAETTNSAIDVPGVPHCEERSTSTFKKIDLLPKDSDSIVQEKTTAVTENTSLTVGQTSVHSTREEIDTGVYDMLKDFVVA